MIIYDAFLRTAPWPWACRWALWWWWPPN